MPVLDRPQARRSRASACPGRHRDTKPADLSLQAPDPLAHTPVRAAARQAAKDAQGRLVAWMLSTLSTGGWHGSPALREAPFTSRRSSPCPARARLWHRVCTRAAQ